MASITSNPHEAPVAAKKGRRKPLKNLSASETNSSVGRSMMNPDNENREGLALLLSPAKPKPNGKAKPKKASPSAELEELRGMFQKLRIEKAKADELLKEREETIRRKEEEIESREKEQERLIKEVKKLQKMKEFKPVMSVPITRSLGEEEEIGDGTTKKRKNKKPRAAYLLFSKDHWSEVKKENPEATFKEISNLIGSKWKSLSSEERRPYEERYEKDKEEYLQMVRKERREEAAMKLLEVERTQRAAMELLDQYLHFKQESEKEVKKPKKDRDPMKPKKPISAFFIYTRERREALLMKNKNILEIAKITGEEWKNMSEEKKAPYEEIARKQKEEYLKLMEIYKQNKAEESEKRQKDQEEQRKIMKQEAMQMLKKKEKTEDIIKKNKDKKKKIKEGKNTDPYKPKKPASSFLLFCKEARKSLMQERPDLQNSTLNALISVKWKELSDEERRVWSDKALEAMTAYHKEMENYNKLGLEEEAAQA